MKKLDVHDIVEIHRLGIQIWGGDGSIRSDTLAGVDGALHAALYASAQNEFGEPDPLAYAAGILTYLGRAQHFVDGNKRAAWGGCVRALEINGFTVRAKTDDIIRFLEEIVVMRLGVEEVADRLGQWVEVLD